MFANCWRSFPFGVFCKKKWCPITSFSSQTPPKTKSSQPTLNRNLARKIQRTKLMKQILCLLVIKMGNQNPDPAWYINKQSQRYLPFPTGNTSTYCRVDVSLVVINFLVESKNQRMLLGEVAPFWGWFMNDIEWPYISHHFTKKTSPESNARIHHLSFHPAARTASLDLIW